MPELPEVEVIRRGLAKELAAKRIAAVTVLEKRSFVGVAEQLIGKQIGEFKRRGKLLIISLSESYTLLIHLRMSGQLIYRDGTSSGESLFAAGFPNASLIGELPDKTTRVIIEFDDGSKLFFNDQRKFGYLKLVDSSQLESDSFLAKLGPEPLDSSFGWKDLREALGAKSNISIKAALLDQHRLAGIGNIYADESLFRAKIDPRRKVSTLNSADYKRLLAGIQECLTQSIDAGGSTWRNYTDALGLRGEFLDLHAAVYGRTDMPCLRCQTPIVKIKLAGRGTHLCEKCQS